MSRTAILISVALSLAFAPAPLARRTTKAPPPSILGSWSSNRHRDVTLVITPTTLEYSYQGGNRYAYDLTFDANKSPATYDVGGRGKSNHSGIWRVDGDKLILYHRPGVNTRPASFEDHLGIEETYKRLPQ